MPVQTATVPGNALPADTPQQASIPQLQGRNPRYRIQNGDTISLNFRFTPQFDTTASVQPDGYIGLREINDFKAEGLTVPELNQALQTSRKPSMILS